jgi:hypothetical protein
MPGAQKRAVLRSQGQKRRAAQGETLGMRLISTNAIAPVSAHLICRELPSGGA